MADKEAVRLSTIVRAFEWCLYGKNGFEDPVLLNSEVRVNMNVGDVQDTWVSVNFTHDNREYTLRRLFKYVCSERKISGDGTVEVTLNKKPENYYYLRQHRTMGAAGFGVSFVPIVQSGKWEIHPVFPHFPYFRLVQNLSPNLLAPLCGVALDIIILPTS